MMNPHARYDPAEPAYHHTYAFDVDALPPVPDLRYEMPPHQKVSLHGADDEDEYLYTEDGRKVRKPREKVNHATHCLLCACTGGWWLPFWVAACAGVCCKRPCGI